MASLTTSTPRGQQQADVPVDYWNAKGPKLQFGNEEFRLIWLRYKKSALNISDYTETFSWTEDETGIPKGTLSLRTPGTLAPLGLQEGEQIRCDVRRGKGAFREVWRMRVNSPLRTYTDGSTGAQLANDLTLLQQSEDIFIYKRDKRRHPKGWKYDQIIADVCQRYGIRKVVPVAGKHWIKNLVITDASGNEVSNLNQASPLDVILSAVHAEMTATHSLLHVRMEKGVLYVLPRRRSKLMVALGPYVMAAALSSALGRNDKPFASALTVRNTALDQQPTTDTKGRQKKLPRKIVQKVSSAASVARYGFVHRNVFAPDADSAAEARAWGAAYLAWLARPTKSLTITHPGIPTLRRMDAIRVKVSQDAAVTNAIVFVNAITHNVGGGNYTMDVDLQFEDPFVDPAPDRIQEDMEAKAVERNRTVKKKTTKTTTPTPTTNTKRADDPHPFASGVSSAGRQ